MSTGKEKRRRNRRKALERSWQDPGPPPSQAIGRFHLDMRDALLTQATLPLFIRGRRHSNSQAQSSDAA